MMGVAWKRGYCGRSNGLVPWCEVWVWWVWPRNEAMVSDCLVLWHRMCVCVCTHAVGVAMVGRCCGMRLVAVPQDVCGERIQFVVSVYIVCGR